MALQVSSQHVPYLQAFVELPEERIQLFLDALASAGQKFNIYDLAAYVSSRTKLPKNLTEAVLRVLSGLYQTRDSQGTPLDTFVSEQVVPTLKRVLALPAEGPPEGRSAEKTDIHRIQDVEARWAKLSKFLMAALALDDTVGTASKAGYVLTEHERIFIDARVLTDLRPIFHPDLSEKPTAAVLVHMLRLSTRDMYGKRSAEYIALDANDVRLLKRILDRALQKEEALKGVMANSGVNILDPKAVF